MWRMKVSGVKNSLSRSMNNVYYRLKICYDSSIIIAAISTAILENIADYYAPDQLVLIDNYYANPLNTFDRVVLGLYRLLVLMSKLGLRLLKLYRKVMIKLGKLLIIYMKKSKAKSKAKKEAKKAYGADYKGRKLID